jgi:DNA-binding NarL/FixJ family response regulator
MPNDIDRSRCITGRGEARRCGTPAGVDFGRAMSMVGPNFSDPDHLMPAMSSIALVADDHELFRIALVSLLKERLGFAKVLQAESLDQAFERLGDAGNVSLARFDLGMPGMAGAGSLAAVRECFPSVKIVVVSASTSRRDILAALESGVYGYVPKSAGLEETARAIREVLDGRMSVPAILAEKASLSTSVADPALPASVEMPDVELTLRQKQVLELLTQGKPNREICRILSLKEGTVKIHIAALFRNLGVRNRAAAVAMGTRLAGEGGSGADAN